jgi:hypothetical protein
MMVLIPGDLLEDGQANTDKCGDTKTWTQRNRESLLLFGKHAFDVSEFLFGFRAAA